MGYISLPLPNGSCQCVSGKYPNVVCQPCYFLCKECSGPNPDKCTQCDLSSGFTLSNGQCKCSLHYYVNFNTIKCNICDPSCTECFDFGKENCINCHTQYYRAANGCECIYINKLATLHVINVSEKHLMIVLHAI